MKVKITEANRRAINILLGEINGKSLSHTGNADKDRLSLTPAQRDIAVSKFTAQFSVQQVVELAVAA